MTNPEATIPIYIWPDDSWCEPNELNELTHKSDDYSVAWLTEREYRCLLNQDLFYLL